MFTGCTTDSIYSIEETETYDQTPVMFSLNHHTQDGKNRRSNSNMALPKDGSSVAVSMEEEKWEDKEFSETKTSWATSGTAVTWTAGDKVGIFMRDASAMPVTYFNRDNVQYNINTAGTASSLLSPNTPSSAIYFPNPSSKNVKFLAYYPYSASNNSLVLNYTLPTDQSTATALSSADLMNATSTANGASPNITLAFNHRMTLLSFKINTLLLSGTLNKVSVSGTAITNTGTLDLSSSVLTPNTSTTFSPYKTIGQTVGPSTYAYVDIIINPCVLTSNSGSSQLKVTLEFNGLLGTHTTNLNLSSFTFAQGTRYIYNLTVTLSI